MMEPAPKPELLYSLGRLTKGLSALFWGLPAALVVCVQSAKTTWLDAVGPISIFVPFLTTAFLLYGLSLMTSFQKQERVWQRALEQAKILALVATGLSPFLYWWHRLPTERLYSVSVGVFSIACWALLLSLNHVLRRLAAMLPDETLRQETRVFTSFNFSSLGTILLLILLYWNLFLFRHLPSHVLNMTSPFQEAAFSLIVFFSLLPVAMTMALLWKMKETIFAGVFGPPPVQTSN